MENGRDMNEDGWCHTQASIENMKDKPWGNDGHKNIWFLDKRKGNGTIQNRKEK
jgi:hypothetical protein